MITPRAASVPYRLAPAAPWTTSTVSTHLGSTARAAESRSTRPSRITRGPALSDAGRRHARKRGAGVTADTSAAIAGDARSGSSGESGDSVSQPASRATPARTKRQWVIQLSGCVSVSARSHTPYPRTRRSHHHSRIVDRQRVQVSLTSGCAADTPIMRRRSRRFHTVTVSTNHRYSALSAASSDAASIACSTLAVPCWTARNESTPTGLLVSAATYAL
jgi:hypothetical protein